MKVLNVVFLGLLSTIPCCSVVHAQDTIPYVRTLVRKIQQTPASVRAFMPKQANPIFTGVWKPPPANKSNIKSREILLHFYALPGRRIKNTGSTLTTRDYFLTIFTPSISRKHSRWRRLQTVHLGSQGDYSFSDGFVMWLDPKQQRMPIIGLHLFDPADFTTSGKEVLVIFPKGLSGEPVVQSFKYWGTNSETLNLKFDKTDGRGFLIVTKSYQGQNAEAHGFPKADVSGDMFGEQPRTHMNLYWNGKQFSVATTARTEQK